MLTQLSQLKHPQTLAMPQCHDAGGQRSMHSTQGVTAGLNWGSSGSAIRTTHTPISVKVHNTPQLSPDHWHGRPKQLQSTMSMYIPGVFNARIIGKLHHKSPVGAVAVCGVDAHWETPPGPHHWQRIMSMHTSGALCVLRNNVYQKYLWNSCYSAYTVFTLLNGMSASLVCDK